MAHVRKDTLTPPKEWRKHLHPDWKRITNKAERRAAKKEIRNVL